MSEDPILKKLDAILDVNIGKQDAKLFFDLRASMRELLAETAVEQIHICAERMPGWIEEGVVAALIRARFGLAPKEGTT